MDVESFVTRGLLHYPSLFHNRLDVLHHGLMVLGNGYQWKDGELASTYDENPQDALERESARGEELYQQWRTGHRDLHQEAPREYNFMVELYNDQRLQRIEIAQLVRSQLETRRQDLRPRRAEAYPQSDGALLMTVPQDIQPDWQEASDQMWEYALQHGWTKSFVSPY